ncbi:hypothetical protein [Mycoplasmopsis cricetuli]|uniref:hypothetical protein n=1 Tax=Mycoplasmopsis cricetuli TaxID=171283 RepID=UPI0004717040|nr:hypothetical protein [Mycoplasmopsis cricetuli]
MFLSKNQYNINECKKKEGFWDEKKYKFVFFAGWVPLSAAVLSQVSFVTNISNQAVKSINSKNIELSQTEILKEKILEQTSLSFQGKEDTKELKKLLKEYYINFNNSSMSNQKIDYDKLAKSLIDSAKSNFNNKKELEQAWYHWFQMAFWWGVYWATEIVSIILHEINSIINFANDIIVSYDEYVSYQKNTQYDTYIRALKVFELYVKNNYNVKLVDINYLIAEELGSLLKEILLRSSIVLAKEVSNAIIKLLDSAKFSALTKYYYYKDLYNNY